MYKTTVSPPRGGGDKKNDFRRGLDKKNDFWSSRTRSFSQKVCPFWIKLDFFYYLFIFFYFFVNLYPTAPTKCCIPHCCHQMLYPTLLSPNVVYRFVATKCRKLDKKNDYRRWGGGKKNDFWWFYTPLHKCKPIIN